MCAKHYENPTMLSEVTAKMSGMFFLRHTVVTDLWRGSWRRRQQVREEVNDVTRKLRGTGPSGIWP